MEIVFFNRYYLDNALIQLVHHSLAIERITPSLAGRIGDTLSGKKDKREFYEVQNNKSTFVAYVLGCIERGKTMTIE